MRSSSLVPTNLLEWPRVRPLLPEQKFIFQSLWSAPFICSAGYGELPLLGFSKPLGIEPEPVMTGIFNLQSAGLVAHDEDTGEIFIVDWFRFHRFKGVGVGIANREIQNVRSERLKKLILEKSKGCFPTPPPTSSPSSSNKTPPPPYIPPEGGGGGVFDEAQTHNPTTPSENHIQVFLAAAGNPPTLAACTSKLSKVLGVATTEQARLAGLAWANTKECDSPVGLAVQLCRSAAQGNVTPCRAAKDEALCAAKAEREQAFTRLRALDRRKFLTPEGRTARVEGEWIFIEELRASVGGNDALACLAAIEEGRWQPTTS